MEKTLKFEVMLRDGNVMSIECTQEFIDRVHEATGASDDAAVRQFIHSALNNALRGWNGEITSEMT